MSIFAKASIDEAGVVELVDTQDLKSCGLYGRAGSSPASGTFKAPEKGAFYFFGYNIGTTLFTLQPFVLIYFRLWQTLVNRLFLSSHSY